MMRSAALRFCVLFAGLASTALAQADPLGVPADVRKKLDVFFERYMRAAPDRKIVIEPDWRLPPDGFTIIRARLTAAEERFQENLPSLLSPDHSQVFIGPAIQLSEDPAKVLGAEGEKLVSKVVSEKSKSQVEVTWSKQKGPAGSFPARIWQASEFGRMPIDGYLTGDGKWLLVGVFYPLDKDPRKVRIERVPLDGLPVRGPKNAPVTLIEFSDYQCPTCGKYQKDIDAVLEKFAGKVRLVHVDRPIVNIHDWAFPAAVGSRCVEKMAGADAYWKYKSFVYERQSDIKADTFVSIVEPLLETLGVAAADWNRCRTSGDEMSKLVIRDLEIASRVGVNGTPTLFVNGALVDMALDKTLEPAVRQALAGK